MQREDKNGRSLRLFNTVEPIDAGIMPLITAENLRGPGLSGTDLERFWASVFEEDALTLETTFNQRTVAGWRIVRYLARMRGAIQPDEGIEAAVHNGPDVFYRPFTSFVAFEDNFVRGVLERSDNGLPLLPPAIHSNYLSDGRVVPTYDPEYDNELRLFRSMVDYIGRAKLGLPHSKVAKHGFVWFVQCDTLRAAFPSLEELIRFERRLAKETMDAMVDTNYQQAFKDVQEGYDLSFDEAQAVMKLARKCAFEFVDPEDLRGIKALVLLRMQKCAKQAEEALDHRGAAMIERDMWRIARDKGQTEEEDELGEMADVVKAHARSRREKKGELRIE